MFFTVNTKKENAVPSIQTSVATGSDASPTVPGSVDLRGAPAPQPFWRDNVLLQYSRLYPGTLRASSRAFVAKVHSPLPKCMGIATAPWVLTLPFHFEVLSVRGAPPYLWTAQMERLVQMRIAQSRSKCHLLKIPSDLLVRAPRILAKTF